MNGALRVLGWEVRGFLFLLATLLVYRMLTREISLRGLLVRKDGSRQVSPERVQLLVTTLAVSFQFIGATIHQTGETMPDVSTPALFVFGGSSGIFAAVKALTTFRRG